VLAPLQEHDAIFGMPFLADEGILVDPVQGKVVLPRSQESQILESPPIEEIKLHTDDEPISPSLVKNCDIPNTASLEKDMAMDLRKEQVEDELEFLEPSFHSICPKVTTASRKITELDLGWVKALQDFEVSRPDAAELQRYLVKFNGTLPSDPAELNEYFAKVNKYFLKRYSDVFTENLPHRLPHADAPHHRIILDNENVSLNGRMYRIPTRYWSKLKDFIEMHLKAGRIRPSHSHIASGTIIVPKASDPDGMPRVVHDYRALNAETVKDHTLLTHQEDIIDCMARAVVRGKIDLVCAYYQILMEIADIHKMAFKTPFGMYQWLVMPQGLCNAVATFQRYMNWILRDYVGKFCAVYIDDIAIWSDSVEDHAEHVRLILDKLREAGICASIKKSVLFVDEIHFLGHRISSRGVEPAETKVDKIIASRVPSSPLDIKEFLGLINYIGQFLPGLSEWSAVLSDLTHKGTKFEWLPEHDEAFYNIKSLTKNYPVCKPIDYDNPDPVMLVADASNQGLSGYFGQGKDYKMMVPAGFHS